MEYSVDSTKTVQR